MPDHGCAMVREPHVPGRTWDNLNCLLALACMETFWINESKPLELKSFSGICAPPVHMSVEVNVL